MIRNNSLCINLSNDKKYMTKGLVFELGPYMLTPKKQGDQLQCLGL